MPYELFPPYYVPRKIPSSGAAERVDKGDQEQDELQTAHDSDSSYSALDPDDGPDNPQPSAPSAGRIIVRYSSEERRDMVAHLAKYPGSNWENYTSKVSSHRRSFSHVKQN